MLRHFISLPWMLIPAPDQMMYAACKRLGHVPYGAGLQSRWTPGTEREVINMVTHLKIISDLREREREVRRLVSVKFNIFFLILPIYKSYLSPKIVPAMEKNRLARIHRCLWKHNTSVQITSRVIPLQPLIKYMHVCSNVQVTRIA